MLLERTVARLLDDAELFVNPVKPLSDRFTFWLEAARLIEEPRDERRPLVERQQSLVRDPVNRTHGARGAHAAGTLDDQVFRQIWALQNGAVKIVDLDIAGNRRGRRRRFDIKFDFRLRPFGWRRRPGRVQ